MLVATQATISCSLVSTHLYTSQLYLHVVTTPQLLVIGVDFDQKKRHHEANIRNTLPRRRGHVKVSYYLNGWP